jgi:hypothetical protein
MRPVGKQRISNLFVLFGLTVGGAIMAFYYQVELAARIYCPREVRAVIRMVTGYSFVLQLSTVQLDNFFQTPTI